MGTNLTKTRQKDATQRDVDRERRLRADTETRLRETVSESERYRATLAGLQSEFSKMEDTVRTMLQYKTRCELLNQEKVFLAAAFESRVHQYQYTITKLGQENESLKQQVRLLETKGTEKVPTVILERLRSLEMENAYLSQDAEFQRKQYERCLDDIANQVVKALFSQKSLREEIGNLQRRIKELENQNLVLANILTSKPRNKISAFALPLSDGKLNDEKNVSAMFPGMFCPFKSDLCANSQALNTTSSSKSEDKKRLRRLHFSDLGDKNILKSLSSFESLVVVPIQRPRSLNLHANSGLMALSSLTTVSNKRCQHKKVKSNLVTATKQSREDEGNESPESGNRDEGYSTMSSDVQGSGETNELSKRELEDLKEASDETDVILDPDREITSIVLIEDKLDPDILFIPLNFSISNNPRHSYPPSKEFLPYQHVMRSFSDSHLFLKFTTSGISSPHSPSVFLVDISDTNRPLRRTRGTSSLLTKEEAKDTDDTQSSTGSWCSGIVENCWWDTGNVQNCLKLGDNRLKLIQHQRDLYQLHYDRTEIEEWSMSLSCEDIMKSADGELSISCKLDTMVGALPCIQENNFGSSGGEMKEWSDCNVVNLTIETKPEDGGDWPYEENDLGEKSTWQINSPIGSWSSNGTNNGNCCFSLSDYYLNDYNNMESKDLPECSDDAEKSSVIGTNFTRDFYRLVKFESTKSLASYSSKSNGNCDMCTLSQNKSEFAQDRELALQSVLNFIVEQQKYCHEREEKDNESHIKCRPKSLETSADGERKVELKLEKDEHNKEESPNVDNHPEVYNLCLNEGIELKSDNIGNDFSKLRSSEELVPGMNLLIPSFSFELVSERLQNTSSGNYQNNDNSTILPVKNSKHSMQFSSKKEKIQRTENFNKCLETNEFKSVCTSQIKKKENNVSANNNCNEIKACKNKEIAESCVSSIPTSTKKSKPKGLRLGSPGAVRETGIPVFTTKRFESNSKPKQSTVETKILRPRTNPRVRGTKIPIISTRKSSTANKPNLLDLSLPKPNSSREINNEASMPLRSDLSKQNVKQIKTPENLKAAVVDDTGFHEKVTSKDVIDELNRIIRKGEEVTPNSLDGELKPLDIACCCPTGWVHVERDIDFTDPKARANLLDVMLASSGSSGGSGNSSDSGGDELVDYTHLHKLHRFRRQKKASATKEQWGALRYSLSSTRPTIVGRENFFTRYGDKEKEAVASFDFLEDISTTSLSGCSSCDSLELTQNSCSKFVSSPAEQNSPSPEIDVCTPKTPTTPVTPSDDSDERTGGPVSLSDSCADSYPDSTASLEEQS